jgi:phosphoribosyl-dephospho-CoA transferase
LKKNAGWELYGPPALVKSITTPPQLLKRSVPMFRADSVPAFGSLLLLKDRWTVFDCLWGPGGSVGFELATGSHAAKPESDLDIIIYADEPITTDEAKSLCALTSGLPAPVDIRVETSTCGFALKEYASQGLAPILLRTPRGARLGTVSWSEGGESE